MRVALYALALSLVAGSASAEVSEVRFVRQLGLGYLQLYVMQDQKLVEKHAEQAGVKGLKVSYVPLGSPAALNDALLTGSAEYGASGVPPFITLWDKTRANIRVKGVAALNAQPAFLNTNKAGIKTLRDFTDQDRIALPSVKISFQALILQMAAEKEFGPGEQFRLDKLTVGLAHPDGTAALLSGRTEVTAHFTSSPFQYIQLQDAKIHRVLSSYDVTDGPSSFSALWTSTRFRDDNPKVHAAVLAATQEATAFIKANPAESARIFNRIEKSSMSEPEVEKLLADKDMIYSTTPQGIGKFTDFMARVGSISARPQGWQDLFFPEIHTQPGS